MMKKQIKGFTLIELLIAVAVIGTLSVVTTKLLFSSVLAKSKQQSIEVSTNTIHLFLAEVTKLIQEAQSVSLPSTNSIEIVNSSGCTRFRYITGSIEKAFDANTPCNATTYSKVTDNDIKISSLQFSKYPSVSYLPNSVAISILGVINDPFGEHPFNYETTVFPRLNY